MPTQKQKLANKLSKKDRLKKLIELFRLHIGSRNEISKKQLFEAIFGSVNQYTNLEIFFYWTILKQDLNWLRRTTKCFVVCRPMETGYKYFVVKDMYDAEFYINLLQKNIRKSNFMIKRCKEAVEKNFYKNF
jgi:hypothetical protein